MKVIFSRLVVRVDDAAGSRKVRLWTQDDEEWSADLVVGADGKEEV